MVQLGILLFSAAVLFQLVTLPVELNASSRAVKLLMLRAFFPAARWTAPDGCWERRALTYVAAAAGSILQLLRLIILFGGRRDND